MIGAEPSAVYRDIQMLFAAGAREVLGVLANPGVAGRDRVMVAGPRDWRGDEACDDHCGGWGDLFHTGTYAPGRSDLTAS